MEKIKYKGFKIKLIADEFAESPLNNQTLPKDLFIEQAHRRETGTNYAAYLSGKIDTDCIDGATFFDFEEEYELQPGEYLFEVHSLDEWDRCENPLEAAKKTIQSIAEELYYYHNGEVFGYEVKYKKEVVDSCWGFYGAEWCLQSAKDFVDGYSIESLLELELPNKVVLK
jgi:hypothetical protein